MFGRLCWGYVLQAEYAEAAAGKIASTEISNLLNHYPFLSADQGLLDRLRSAISEGVAEKLVRTDG